MGTGSSCCQQQQLEHVSNDESSEAKISQQKYDLTKEEKKGNLPPNTVTFGAPSILSSNRFGSAQHIDGMTDAHDFKAGYTHIGGHVEGQPAHSNIHELDVQTVRKFGSELHPNNLPRSPRADGGTWQSIAGGFDTFAGTKITQGKSDVNTDCPGDTKNASSSHRAVSSTVGVLGNPQMEAKKSAFFNPTSGKQFEKPLPEVPHELSISREGRDRPITYRPSIDEADNRDSVVGRKSSQTLGVSGQALKLSRDKRSSNSMLGLLVDAEEGHSNLAGITSQERHLNPGHTRIENGHKSTALDDIDKNFELSGIGAPMTPNLNKPDQRYLEQVLQDISQVG